MNEEQRKIMIELYRTDPNFKALLWENFRLETRSKTECKSK
jgi:hypothetical protein